MIDFTYVDQTVSSLSVDDQNALSNLSKIGLRYNSGKIRFELAAPDAERAVAEVFTYGANKYSSRNYELGMPWMDIVASMKRHLNAWELGETYDDESKLRHLAHHAWNALALLTYELRGIGTDDRPIINKQGELNID